MSERRGYIQISRKFFEDDTWWNEKRARSRAEAWLDMIYLAAWKPRKFAIGYEVEHLKRGEVVASLRFLAQRWRWSKSTVERWFRAAEKAGRIVRQREGQAGTVYLLVNYEHYQSPTGGGGTPDGTANGTTVGHLRDKTEAGKAGNKILADLVANGCEVWKAEMGGPLNFPRLRKAWKPLLDDLPPGEILNRWRNYFARNQRADDRRYLSPEHFSGRIGLFGEATTVEMTDDLGVMRLHRKNEQGEWEVAS